MSVQATPATSSVPYDGYGEEDRGYGWVIFAGVLLLGTLNAIEGLAAIGNTHFFVHITNYIFRSLNTWGWAVLCIGVLELLVGLGVFLKNQFARRTGVVVARRQRHRAAADDACVPVLVADDFAIDILAVYGLIAHGKRIGEG